MVKNTLVSILLSLLFLTFSACSQEDDSVHYFDGPLTQTGKILMESTSSVDKFSKDTTYYLSDNLNVSEIAYRSTKGQPVRLFLFEVQLGENLWIEASMPDNNFEFGRQTLSMQAVSTDKPGSWVLGGVNGDFFRMENGWPSGMYVSRGRVLKEYYGGSSQTFFAIDTSGNALIAGNERFKDIKHLLKEVVGGSVWLLKDGENIAEASHTDPRTAVGVSADQSRVYLLVVDGRNPQYSVGMNYSNLAKFFQGLGAENAINLDGGGSSTFVVRNTGKIPIPPFLVRNLPADPGGRERPVANGLLILSKETP